MWDEDSAGRRRHRRRRDGRAPRCRCCRSRCSGDLNGRAPVLRSRSEAGAVLAVASEVGRSAAGYSLVEQGFGRFEELRGLPLVPGASRWSGGWRADADALGDDRRLRWASRRPRASPWRRISVSAVHRGAGSGSRRAERGRGGGAATINGRGARRRQRPRPGGLFSPATRHQDGASIGAGVAGRPRCSSTARVAGETRLGSRSRGDLGCAVTGASTA